MKGFEYCDLYQNYYREDGSWECDRCYDPKCLFCSKRPEYHPDNCEACYGYNPNVKPLYMKEKAVS